MTLLVLNFTDDSENIKLCNSSSISERISARSAFESPFEGKILLSTQALNFGAIKEEISPRLEENSNIISSTKSPNQ